MSRSFPSVADLVLVNPRCEVSLRGMEHPVPFLDERANLPVACVRLLAALPPEEHAVNLMDEFVEAIDWERCARAAIDGITGMSVQRFRMRESLVEVERSG